MSSTLMARKLAAWLCAGLLFFQFSNSARCAADTSFRFGALFTDGAVLQRDQPIPVWGWATPGAEIAVSFKASSAKTKAGDDGRWQVVLPAMAADANGATLSATSNSQSVTAHDVLVGEVWICGGRSNMAVIAGKIPDSGAVLADRNSPLLRICALPGSIKGAPEPLSDLPAPVAWKKATPALLSGYSAVAGLFGSELQTALNVPVGIIANNWGGSTAPLWIRYEAFQAFKTSGGKAVSDAELEQRSADYHRQTGDYADERRPGNLYNTRFAPLIPYSVRGVVWYLDDGTGPITEAMILDWRRQWKQPHLAVLLVQNHPAGVPASDANAPDLLKGALGGPKARQEFMELTHRLPDCWAVVTTDTGDATNPKEIHPANKLPIAQRLSLIARESIYGQPVIGHSPEVSKVHLQGNAVVVSFSHAGDGLRTLAGGPIKGFALSQDGKQWVWADASLSAPDTVLLSAAGMPTPKYVRFAYAAFPVFDLYNSAGLPASPFESKVD